MLRDEFVVGWKNIHREDFVGASHGYTCEESAVGTTNGAGPRNTQMFVLTPGGIVLHCLPGFWHPEDLARELELSKALHRLWSDKRKTSTKRKMFSRLHMAELRSQPKTTTQRSGWQGFDAAEERKRLAKEPRDTFYLDAQGKPTKRLKPLNVLVHERMAARPFVHIGRFDTETFVDYGRAYYDNNKRTDGIGVRFGSKGYMESQRRMAERKRARDAKDEKRVAEKQAAEKAAAEKQAAQKKRRGKPTSRPTSRPSRTRR